jgi:hypothetical protein
MRPLRPSISTLLASLDPHGPRTRSAHRGSLNYSLREPQCATTRAPDGAYRDCQTLAGARKWRVHVLPRLQGQPERPARTLG